MHLYQITPPWSRLDWVQTACRVKLICLEKNAADIFTCFSTAKELFNCTNHICIFEHCFHFHSKKHVKMITLLAKFTIKIKS